VTTKKKPDVPYIAPPLRGLAVLLATLTLDPKNARKHDDANLKATENSMAKFGQRLPIVVQKQGMVVRAGNGRVQVARRMGWQYIAAVVVDESDAEAAAFALADNRSAELAEWDWARLAETLEELNVELPDFDTGLLGWTTEELAGLSLAGDWDNPGASDDSLTGNPANPRGGAVVLKFNDEEAVRLATAMRNAGHDELSPATVLAVLEADHC